MSSILPDWDLNLLEELIQARGDDVILETGIACSCRRDDALAGLTTKENQPSTFRKINCTACQGDGFIYRNARCVRGLVTSVQGGPNRRLIEGGYAVPGDAVFSPSTCAGFVGDFDKVTFTYADSIGDGQVIMRGAATYGENADRLTHTQRDEDRLWYQAADALWCEDENQVVYTPNVDFVLEDKRITWIGAKPAVGVFYTLKYTAYLEWIVYNTPLLRMDNNRSLLQRVLLRKKHVAFTTGSPADTPAKRKDEQESLTIRAKI